ncbi:vitamin B12 dependent-methionine synthase activation domain-containing protein [Nocardia sp. NPDC059091]|uniref:vitamin B12 dependent-methionine synthase activation domain-containing protein n=1 Tax=unclassified Nocardia TaxID=2637762 RepID=UPI0036D0904E
MRAHQLLGLHQQFFFLAWEPKGKYPAILEQLAARELFDGANTLLDQIIADGSCRAVGAYGFWPGSVSSAGAQALDRIGDCADSEHARGQE